MKKIVQITALFAVVCSLFVGCDKPNSVAKEEAEKVKLNLSVDKISIDVGAEAKITIKALKALDEALVVNIASDNAAAEAPKTVTIEGGKDVATAIVKGISAGKAKITITAEGVEYGVQSVEITVNGKDTPKPDAFVIAKLSATGKMTPSDPYMSFVCESDEFGTTYPGCLYYHKYDKSYNITNVGRSSIDYYGGSAVGTLVGEEVFFKPYPEGTLINDDLPWLDYYSTYFRFPNMVKEDDAASSIPSGTHFIVMTLPRDGHPGNDWSSAVYKYCWLKINVDGMNVEVLDGAMLVDGEGEFKVGQKE